MGLSEGGQLDPDMVKVSKPSAVLEDIYLLSGKDIIYNVKAFNSLETNEFKKLMKLMWTYPPIALRQRSDTYIDPK